MDKILRVFKIKELRSKIFFVLGLLLVFRLLASIPVPGVNLDGLREFFEQGSATSELLSLVNVFTGGGISTFSIVMLGVAPYITASIVMQLLTMIFPRLEEMYKEEGEIGRSKFNQFTRYLAVPLAALNAFGYITLFQNQTIAVDGDQVPIIGDIGILEKIAMISLVVAGTMFIMWLGELITEKNIGNGISYIIFASILSGVPTTVIRMVQGYESSALVPYLIFVLVFLAVIAGVIFITEGQRNIPISYAKRIKGSKLYGGTSTYLPLRVNQTGVIPIIFAMSIMMFPGMVATFLTNVDMWNIGGIAENVAGFFDQGKYSYTLLFFSLVVAFTYFYTSVTFDPKQISENLQKQGGFIPGVRPGEQTAQYLGKTLNRIILAGAVFLGSIAVLPNVVQKLITTFGLTSSGLGSLTIGGTGLLIIVSVALEIVKQIQSQLVIRNYDES